MSKDNILGRQLINFYNLNPRIFSNLMWREVVRRMETGSLKSVFSHWGKLTYLSKS